MDLIYVIDLMGTLAFAISGAYAAAQSKMDPFGLLIIAFFTAVGGGTIRDILIGSQPVAWMLDLNYLWMVLIAVVAYLVFREKILKWNKTLFLFDSIGLGLFTILGIEKTLGFGLSPVIAVLMGVVSASFGGVVRDVLSNRVPLIFREEIYATACLAGGIVFLILDFLEVPYVLKYFIPILLTITIRVLAVRRHWALPKL